MSAPPRVLILSGPTREYLDPVRYISNASSGRQGVALAREALERGYGVEMIQGPVEVSAPDGARVFEVTTAAEMLESAIARHPFCDVLIGAAAVSDFRAVEVPDSKKRRSGEWQLTLEPTEDILLYLAKSKGWRVHVGFALETDRPLENGLRKLLEKKLDWIVVNAPDAIGAEDAAFTILGSEGAKFDLGTVSKETLASRLFDRIDLSLNNLRTGSSN